MWNAFVIGLTILSASLPTSVLNEDIFETSLIIGGAETDIKTAPYQVWIPERGCGGSIVSKDYILTAAHCVDNGETYEIRAGSSYRTSGGVLVKSKAISHPQFNISNGFDHDVALLKLEKPLELSDSITIIKMTNEKQEVPDGELVVLSGWGSETDSENSPPVEILEAVEIKIVHFDDCKKAYESILSLTSNMICAAAEGKDACKGDSGGPLVYKDILVGVASFGKGCAEKGYPGVYTKISALSDWIDENMK